MNVTYKTSKGYTGYGSANFAVNITSAPTPTPAPTPAPVALYSYVNDVSTALPLAGAVLEPKTVYLFYSVSNATSATFYCCKGVSGNAMGDAHSAPVTDTTVPLGIAVDMSKYTTSGAREFYVDYMDSNGVLHTGNYTNFSINVPIVVAPATANINIQWQAPTQRTDGTALASTDLAAFDIVYFDDATGTMRTIKIADPTLRNTQVTSLPRGTTYHFSITVTDTQGYSSTASPVVNLAL